MKRFLKQGLIATIAVVQVAGVAHAQEVIVDLPGFDTPEQQPSTPSPIPPTTQQPQQPQNPPSPVQTQYEGVAQVTSVTRKSGGAMVKIALQQPVILTRVELKVLKSQIKIYEGQVVTASGKRLAIREFTDLDPQGVGTIIVSENLNINEAISSIEIRGESFQAEADIEVKAISSSGVPKLAVQTSELPKPLPPGQPPAPPRPPAPPAPRPPQNPGNCIGDVCMGDRFYNVQREFRLVTVVGLDRSTNTFSLRFEDNGGIGGGWGREVLAATTGCMQGLCVGQRFYNISRDFRIVSIVGLQQEGRFVLRFEDNGGIGGNWSTTDLAAMTGCSGDICVGATAYNISRDSRKVTVVGIQPDTRLILRFEDNGGVGGNWTRQDLALAKGCVGLVCVGDRLLNTQRGYRMVRVLAIDLYSRFVLQFEDNGTIGGNWTSNDLAALKGCGQSFCVGDTVLVRPRNNRTARVVAIQGNGLYVLNFLDVNQIGGNWADGDLLRAR